jgi:hypothetical protein
MTTHISEKTLSSFFSNPWERLYASTNKSYIAFWKKVFLFLISIMGYDFWKFEVILELK